MCIQWGLFVCSECTILNFYLNRICIPKMTGLSVLVELPWLLPVGQQPCSIFLLFGLTTRVKPWNNHSMTIVLL